MKDLPRWVIEEGLISEPQLAQARKLQGDSGVPLPMALLELKLVEEKRLVDVVAKRTGLAKAPRRLHRMDVSPKALSLVPQDYCWQYNLFPFNIDAATRRLQLAIVDPDDQEALATVRRMARLELDLFVAGPKQIEKAIRRHYLDSLIDETNQPAQLRYFGYDNITSPGAAGSSARPPTGMQPAAAAPAPPLQDSGELTWEEPPRAEPKARGLESLPTSDIPLPPPRPSGAAPGSGATPIPPLFPPEVPQSRRPTSAGAPAAPASSPVTGDDLPVLKDPSAALARVQTRPEISELSQRLDTVEHVLSRLIALLAHDSRDTAGQLARLVDETAGLRRRTPG